MSQKMELRGKQLWKFGVLAFSCTIIGFTLSNLYSSDRLLSTHSFNLPGSLKPGSWSGDAPKTTSNPNDLEEYFPFGSATGSKDVGEELIEPETLEIDSQPTIGKVTILFGGDVNPTYERALSTHETHNRKHNYPMHVLRHGILNDVWTKPAYILSLLLQELTKPESERLKWLLWHDADTVLMNPSIPLDAFLPPPTMSDIHLLVTDDFNGLNNGVFPVRVHPWSVELFTAVVSFRAFRPEINLNFRDQSALSEVLKMPQFARHSVRLPQRWFNAYQSADLNETTHPYQLRRGDMLMHFAGVGDRETRMNHWIDIAEQHLPEWELDLRQTSYPGEVKEYWGEQLRLIQQRKEEVENEKKEAKKLIEEVNGNMEEFSDKLASPEREAISAKLVDLQRTADDKETNVEMIREKMNDLHQTLSPLHVHVTASEKETHRAAHDMIFTTESLVLTLPAPPPAPVQKETQDAENQVSAVRELVSTSGEKKKIEEETKRLKQLMQTLDTRMKQEKLGKYKQAQKPAPPAANTAPQRPPPQGSAPTNAQNIGAQVQRGSAEGRGGT
ncbi:MAG: hypothetical protein M1833_004451 [Piccolia ochrophora]|nr:MAG: hypothetical protein M1833_004451 [Piccolia ochrophora]